MTSRISAALFTAFALFALTGCPPEPEPSDNASNKPTTNQEDNSGAQQNQKPIANPGENQIVTLGEVVSLNASASSDPDGDVLEIEWSIASTPDGSSAELENPTGFRATFTPDVVGIYELQLIVSDAKLESDPVSVYIDVRENNTTPTVNTKPTADAGDDTTFFLDQVIVLDGSGSMDAEGDELTYSWTILSKPTDSRASVTDADKEQAILEADLPGDYELQLEVSDDEWTSTPDSVFITVMDVTPTNTPPVAVAGDDQQIDLGQVISLDGSASSDPDGDDITSYQWTISRKPDSSTATIDDPTSPMTAFTPDVGGLYIVQLVVSDDVDFSAPDSIELTVASATSTKPVAVTPTQVFARIGQPTQLDGTGSYDDDGDPLSYRWQLIQKPMNSFILLEGASTSTPTLTPDVGGDYTIRFTVSDDTFTSDPVDVTVTATDSTPGCLVISEYIEGSSSNKAIELYNCSGSTIDLSNVYTCLVPNEKTTCYNKERLTGTLPADGVLGLCNGNLNMSLVDSGDCNSISTITNFNGDDRIVIFEDLDADGELGAADLIYDAFGETSIEPSSKIWADATYKRCDFTPYDGLSNFDIGTYNTLNSDDFSTFGDAPNTTIGCMVTDFPPTADAGSGQNVLTGSQVQLDGTGSSDPEGAMLTYTWSFTSTPMGSTASLDDPTSATPSFTADLDGAYSLELVVSDATQSSAVSTVTITAGPMPAQSGDCLIISEYIEGSSSNKALELYNCSGGSIDLSNVKVCLANNDGSNCDTSVQLSGTLADQDVFGICSTGLSMSLVDAGDCDLTSGAAGFNGDDRLVIYKDNNNNNSPDTGDEIYDAFGQIGTRPSSDTWRDISLRRCNYTTHNPSDAFDATTYFTATGTVDDFSDFGDAPTSTGTMCP